MLWFLPKFTKRCIHPTAWGSTKRPGLCIRLITVSLLLQSVSPWMLHVLPGTGNGVSSGKSHVARMRNLGVVTEVDQDGLFSQYIGHSSRRCSTYGCRNGTSRKCRVCRSCMQDIVSDGSVLTAQYTSKLETRSKCDECQYSDTPVTVSVYCTTSSQTHSESQWSLLQILVICRPPLAGLLRVHP